MSVSDFGITQGCREIRAGLSNLGGSIELAMRMYVEQQQKRTDTGQEIAKQLTAAIEKAAEEIQKIREEG